MIRAAAAAPALLALLAAAPAHAQDGSEKFDPGFLEMVEARIAAELGGARGESGAPVQRVLVVAAADAGGGAADPARASKARLASILEGYGASGVRPASALSFVTADVPLARVADLGRHPEVRLVGDGAAQMAPSAAPPAAAITADALRRIINAQDLSRDGTAYDGSGVRVGVIDGGFYDPLLRPALGARLAAVHSCAPPSACAPAPDRIISDGSLHGAAVAGLIAAGGADYGGARYEGLAPGASVYGAYEPNRLPLGPAGGGLPDAAFVAHAYDWLLGEGARVVNVSLGRPGCSTASSFSFVIDEAVDRGIVAVHAAGNYDSKPSIARERQIGALSCASNVISVGALYQDAAGGLHAADYSSKGPAAGVQFLNLLKPDIAAPGSHVPLLACSAASPCGPAVTHAPRGTSFSAPQVAAASAVLLQARPEWGPAEVRAALLLGANWTGPVPCTASQYARTAGGACSFAARNVTDISLPNNVGLGVLDVGRSLDYALAGGAHVAAGGVGAVPGNATSYELRPVPGAAGPHKVVLSWLRHPHGDIPGNARAPDLPSHSDLDLRIFDSEGSPVHESVTFDHVNEFAVFEDSGSGGPYRAEVSYFGPASGGRPASEAFVLASTMRVEALPEPPWAGDLAGAVARLREGLSEQASGGTLLLNATVPGRPGLSYSWEAESFPPPPGRLGWEQSPHYRGGSADWSPARAPEIGGAGSPEASVRIPHARAVGDLVLVLSVTDGEAARAHRIAVPVAWSEEPGSPADLFYDGFEEGLSGWTVSGGWEAAPLDEGIVPPYHAPGNAAARLEGCPGACEMTSRAVSLAGYESAWLSLLRFVDNEARDGPVLYAGVSSAGPGGEPLPGSTWRGYRAHLASDGVDSWRQHWMHIDPAVTPAVRIEVAGSPASAGVEVAVDDVRIVGVPHGPPSLEASARQPEPGGSVLVRVEADEPVAEFRLESLSVGGRPAAPAGNATRDSGLELLLLPRERGELAFNVTAVDYAGNAASVTQEGLAAPLLVSAPPGPALAAHAALAGGAARVTAFAGAPADFSLDAAPAGSSLEHAGSSHAAYRLGAGPAEFSVTARAARGGPSEVTEAGLPELPLPGPPSLRASHSRVPGGAAVSVVSDLPARILVSSVRDASGAVPYAESSGDRWARVEAAPSGRLELEASAGASRASVSEPWPPGAGPPLRVSAFELGGRAHVAAFSELPASFSIAGASVGGAPAAAEAVSSGPFHVVYALPAGLSGPVAFEVSASHGGHASSATEAALPAPPRARGR